MDYEEVQTLIEEAIADVRRELSIDIDNLERQIGELEDDIQALIDATEPRAESARHT